jgi:hypothetical protein
MAFLLLVNGGTYRGLLDGGEHTSRLDDVVRASLAPLDGGGVPPEERNEMKLGLNNKASVPITEVEGFNVCETHRNNIPVLSY